MKIGNSACLNRPFLRHVSPCRIVPAPLAETWPITTRVSWRRIRGIRPSSLRNASIGEARSNREQPDIDSNNPPPLPPPPRKSGLNCCNFFIGEVVKCFMGERAKLAAAAAAAVLLDDHELLKLPGTVRCFRELMEGIRRGMERYDYYTFSIPDIVVCQTSRHVLHTNFSNRRFFFYFFLTLRTMHFSRIFSVRKLVFMEDDISSEVRCKFCKIGVFFPNIRGGGGLLL